MQVSEVMHKGVSTVQIHDSIKKVASLMRREDIGSVPVYKNERPVGFVTDRDIVVSSIAQGHPSDDPISLAMRKDIFLVRENEDVKVALKIMEDKQISRLLVVDTGERPVGMITLHDIAENVPDETLKARALTKIKRS